MCMHVQTVVTDEDLIYPLAHYTESEETHPTAASPLIQRIASLSNEMSELQLSIAKSDVVNAKVKALQLAEDRNAS